MGEFTKQLVTDCMSNEAKCVYFAILIVLILLCTKYLYRLTYGKEGFMDMPKDTPISGGGMGHTGGNTQALSSGPTMRFASRFSQPNQGEYITKYNDDVTYSARAAGVPTPGDEQTVKELEAVAEKVDRQRGRTGRSGRGQMRQGGRMMQTGGQRQQGQGGRMMQTGGRRQQEGLVNNRYGPEFAEYFDDELNKYQSELPPIEYDVVDQISQGSTGAESFVSGEALGRALYPGF